MSPATRRGYKASLLRWDPYVGKLGVRSIVKLHIQRFVADRLAAGTGTPAVRQDLAFLSSLLTYAMGLPGGPDVNVVRHYPKAHLAPPEERDRVLSVAEQKALLAAVKADENPTHLLIVRLALETGMRMGEILKLRKFDVDLDRHHILLPKARTKGRKARLVPVTTDLCAALSAHWKQEKKQSDFALPNPKTGRPFYDVAPWFQNAVRKAGLDDVHFHDLRHTFVTGWLANGGRERVLQEVLGHRSERMTKRYTHVDGRLAQEELRRVVCGKSRAEGDN